MRTALLFALVAGCSAVSDTPGDGARATDPPETVDEYYAMRSERVDRLDEAIGEAQAGGASACRVVALGEKACGGPIEYRVYSATDGDTDRIEALAAEITTLDAYANREFGLVSDCLAVEPPSPVLRDGRCTASGPR